MKSIPEFLLVLILHLLYIVFKKFIELLTERLFIKIRQKLKARKIERWTRKIDRLKKKQNQLSNSILQIELQLTKLTQA